MMDAVVGPLPVQTVIAKRATRAVPLHDDDPAWSSSSGGEGHYKDPEWTEEDQELAKDYYAGLPGNAKAVIDLLIDNFGVQLSADEIGVKLNLVQLWDVATRTNTSTLNTDTSNIASVAFSPDGKLLAMTRHSPAAVADQKAINNEQPRYPDGLVTWDLLLPARARGVRRRAV